VSFFGFNRIWSSTSFGVVSRVSGVPRQLQFALKISY
jgi:hypothetical protein